MKPLPLFGTGIASISKQITSQRRVNCFYDIRKDGDKANIVVRGTPGAFGSFTLTDAPIRGWRVVGNYLYVVAGSTVFQVASDSSFVSLGTIPNSGQYVAMADNSLQLGMVDGSRGYYLTLPAGAPTLITDPFFPNGCTSIDVLNSRAYVETPNTRFFNVSAQLDLSLWSPQIFGTKENASDNLSAVEVFNGALILWGLLNLEFWQDVGLAPNPLQRINGASQTWGLAAKYSRAALNNTKIFLGQNPQGGVQVLMLDGYSPRRVSNSDIENIISNFTIYSDAIGLTYMVDGHPMYQLTFPTANRSFLFDASTEFWYDVQSGVADFVRDFANLAIVFNAKNYVSDVSSGLVYQLSTSIFTQNSYPIKRMVTSRHIRMDGNEFSISEIVLEMETGNGLSFGQGSNPQIMMQASKDGGRTWGPERWKSLGRQGQYRKRLIWDCIGSARDFVFRFTMTDPVSFIICLAEAVLSPGPESTQ
jgi:Phage stabilisation protein